MLKSPYAINAVLCLSIAGNSLLLILQILSAHNICIDDEKFPSFTASALLIFHQDDPSETAFSESRFSHQAQTFTMLHSLAALKA